MTNVGLAYLYERQKAISLKIYTRTGDSGSTGLFGGPRVFKDDVRIEAYGTIDELNAFLGQIRCALVEQASDGTLNGESPELESISVVDDQLALIQHELFSVGAELATPTADVSKIPVVEPPMVERLEEWIDLWEDQLPPLRNFILPAGTPACCATHVARGVSRRAERRVVTLSRQGPETVSEPLIQYLNRLSDYLFVLARYLNHCGGINDVAWES